MATIQNIPKLRFPGFKGEWEKIKLGKLAEKIGDGLHGTPIYSDDSDICFINGNNLTNGKIEITDKTKKVDYAIFKKNDKSLNENTILISLNGTIGNIAKYNNEKVMLGKSVGYFNFKESTNFYFHVFHTDKIQNFFISELTGSTIKNLSLKTLRGTIFPFPSPLEQQKIASFLSAVDEKIQQLSRKKELVEQYKKGVMQQLFSSTSSEQRSGKLRFKDDNGNDYPDWEEKKLGEVANKKSSNISANKIEDNFGDFIIYGASGILKKVDFYKEANDYISIVKDGAGVGRLLYCKEKSSVLGTMEIISPKQNLDTYFLYCLLSNIDFVKYVTGSTIPHIYFKDYSNEICGIPNFTEQQKIANFLSGIDDKIENTKQEINQMQSFKKGLLQQLFV